MLKFEKIHIKSANLGVNSSIPDITAPESPYHFKCDQSVSEKERENIGSGMVSSVLPYKMQSSYNRDFQMQAYDCAVLENEYLKAVFIPALGGRLWSLYDKKLQKNIVYQNDALIFANLALRNAWFAGGVEWNIGIRGHSPFTCSPLFARKVRGKQGHDILRMYEYEEIRGVVFCIEAALEQDKLIMHFTTKNTKSESTYMYWWSNIAVEQKRGTRCFVPAKKAFVTAYREGEYHISKVDVPRYAGREISDPYHADDAIDYFFDIPEDSKKWISAIEDDGKGLLQYSDRRLLGRKIFLWGSIPGGAHWNKWLTDGRDYLEIQAGLCKTQFEHFEIKPGEEIIWNEVYRGVDIGGNKGDYADICNKLERYVPNQVDYQDVFAEAAAEPIRFFGSGKGYLYEKIRGVLLHQKCEFPLESVREDERYYLNVLNGVPATGDENTAFVCGKEWQELLEKRKARTAFDRYILGLVYYTNAQYEKALNCLQSAVREEETFYALAALGLLLSHVFGNHGEAFNCLHRAVALNPGYLPLAVKYGEIAIKSDRYREFIVFYDHTPEHIKSAGRMKMYAGLCLVEIGRLERAKTFINGNLVVEDIREGEYAVSNIWINLYRREMAAELKCNCSEITDLQVLNRHPLPFSIDFRMHKNQ